MSPQNGKSSNEWYFDTLHSKLTWEKEIPDDMRIGAYMNKTDIAPNETFSSAWLKSIVSINDTSFIELGEMER